MKVKTISLLLLVFTYCAHAQKFLDGTLYYKDGSKKNGLINKKIKGSVIKIKDATGTSSSVESSDLSRIILKTKTGDEIWYEYLKYVDGLGVESKKAQWLNKVIDGEMSLYHEGYVAVGNPAGSGDVYYFKRRNEPAALMFRPIKFKAQMNVYFKDQPELLEKVLTRQYGPHDIVNMYNDLMKKN